MYSSMVCTALNFISSELIAGYEIVRTQKQVGVLRQTLYRICNDMSYGPQY